MNSKTDFCYKQCKKCMGTGYILKYPFSSTIMPKQEKSKCEYCEGQGRVFVVPDNAVVVRNSNYKP